MERIKNFFILFFIYGNVIINKMLLIAKKKTVSGIGEKIHFIRTICKEISLSLISKAHYNKRWGYFSL